MQVYTRMVNWDVTYYLNVILGLKIILVLQEVLNTGKILPNRISCKLRWADTRVPSHIIVSVTGVTQGKLMMKFIFAYSLAVLRVFNRSENLFFHHAWIFCSRFLIGSWPRLFKDFSAFQILSPVVICY